LFIRPVFLFPLCQVSNRILEGKKDQKQSSLLEEEDMDGLRLGVRGERGLAGKGRAQLPPIFREHIQDLGGRDVLFTKPSFLVLVLFRATELGQDVWLHLSIDADALLHKALDLDEFSIGSLPRKRKKRRKKNQSRKENKEKVEKGLH
jgi:hypothetical protein